MVIKLHNQVDLGRLNKFRKIYSNVLWYKYHDYTYCFFRGHGNYDYLNLYKGKNRIFYCPKHFNYIGYECGEVHEHDKSFFLSRWQYE